MADVPPPSAETPRPAVRVIGVGATGCRVLAGLAPDVTGPRELIGMDTDSSSLPAVDRGTRVLLGADYLRGIGSGGSAEQAALAVQEQISLLESAVAGARVVFVTGALGGGTAAVVAPALAELAVRAGAVVVGAVLMPFEFEGAARREQAEAGRLSLAGSTHLRVCISGEDLLDPGREAWGSIARGQEMLAGTIDALTEVLTGDSLVNLTLEELAAGFAGTAPAEFARVRVSGADLLHDLGRQLRNCPPLRPRVRSVRRAVAAFACGPEVGPDRMPALVARLKAALPQRSRLSVAAVQDPSLGAGLRLALWVFREDLPAKRYTPEAKPVPAEVESAPDATAVLQDGEPDFLPTPDVSDPPVPATATEETPPVPVTATHGRTTRSGAVQSTMELAAPTEQDMDWEELGSRLDRPTWRRLGLVIRQVGSE